MEALNLYLLTRNSNKSFYSAFENVLSKRKEYKRVKDYEFESLVSLVNKLVANRALIKDLEGFYYSYSIEQIGKEFDLLKIWNNHMVLNIELKSKMIPEREIEEQLKKNKYYLQHIAPTLYLFTYVQETEKFFGLNDNKLYCCSVEDVIKVLKEMEDYNSRGIDELFRATQFLISPLNTPNKFLRNQYFLTQQQNEIKSEIMKRITIGEKKLWGITGSAGTGKTLLLYDLAKSLCEHGKCCIVHSGILCEGHKSLNGKIRNLHITDAKTVTSLYLEPFKFILVDEAQRIYERDLNIILDSANSGNKICVFSYDYFQVLAHSEEKRNIPDILRHIPEFAERKLSNKIRYNKEVASFVRNLFNLNDMPQIPYRYNDVEVIYANCEAEALKILEFYTEQKEYVFIGHTQSRYYYNPIDRFPSNIDTHHVIGQEFDNVITIMDENFKYGDDGRLKGKIHPNPNYIFYKLLYQGLSRAREKLCILVIENMPLFERILSIKARNVPGNCDV